VDPENPDPTAISADFSSAVERLRSLAAAAFGDPARLAQDDSEPDQQDAGDADQGLETDHLEPEESPPPAHD
jgi:hypothetical protein